MLIFWKVVMSIDIFRGDKKASNFQLYGNYFRIILFIVTLSFRFSQAAGCFSIMYKHTLIVR